jgi:hypothetical protein
LIKFRNLRLNEGPISEDVSDTILQKHSWRAMSDAVKMETIASNINHLPWKIRRGCVGALLSEDGKS